MISIIYHSITFNNCIFSNILCNGEVESSSLIVFQSSIYENTMEMKNITFSECKSNSDFIVTKGDASILKISNIEINNVFSYGQLLYILSSNVSFAYIYIKILLND